MIEVPPATSLAREIGARFEKLMSRGGRIDQILAGGAWQRAHPLPDAEIDRILRNLETQIREYKQAMAEAVDWNQKYKKRHKNKGFRCLATNSGS